MILHSADIIATLGNGASLRWMLHSSTFASLEKFLKACKENDPRIIHIKVVINIKFGTD